MSERRDTTVSLRLPGKVRELIDTAAAAKSLEDPSEQLTAFSAEYYGRRVEGGRRLGRILGPRQTSIEVVHRVITHTVFLFLPATPQQRERKPHHELWTHRQGRQGKALRAGA